MSSVKEGEEIKLIAQVQDIADGNTVTFQIWKDGQDPDAGQIPCAQLVAPVEGGEAKATWMYTYEGFGIPPKEDPKFFFTVHSAWCPPKKSETLTEELLRPKLSEAKWSESEGLVGEELTLSVSATDFAEKKGVTFNIFKEGANTKTEQAIISKGATIENGKAKVVWTPTDAREKGDTAELNFFFTVTADKAEEIESGKISIKNWIQIDNLSKSKKLVLVFEDGTEKTITWESKEKKIEYEQRGNVAVFCDENAYEYGSTDIGYGNLYAVYEPVKEVNKEYMVVKLNLKDEIKEDYYVATVLHAREKSKSQMDKDFFQKAIKIRNLETNTLENIPNASNLTEHSILITPILAKSGNTTSIINQKILNERDDRFKNAILTRKNAENEDIPPTYVYSQNYGWIDRGHAGFTDDNSALKELYNNILIAKKDQILSYFQDSRFRKFGLDLTINSATMGILILKDIQDEKTAQGITLSIFQKVSMSFESSQFLTGLVSKSSFAEEDLPSNILNFYSRVIGHSEAEIKELCDCFREEQSLWIYHRYEFKKNSTFDPDLRYPDAESPELFKSIIEKEPGTYTEIINGTAYWREID